MVKIRNNSSLAGLLIGVADYCTQSMKNSQVKVNFCGIYIYNSKIIFLEVHFSKFNKVPESLNRV